MVKTKSYILFISIIIFSLSLVVASEDWGYNYLKGDLDTEQEINYTQLNVNNSQYLRGYTPTTLRSWMQTYFNDYYYDINNPFGFYNSSDGVLSQWVDNGTSIYYNDGSVGIGTSAPNTSLHISSPSSMAFRVDVDGNEPSGSIDAGVLATGGSGILEMAINSEGANPDVSFLINSLTRGQIRYDSSISGLAFLADNTKADSTGLTTNGLVLSGTTNHVGIGENTPLSRLHVKNSVPTIILTEDSAGKFLSTLAGSGNSGLIFDSSGGFKIWSQANANKGTTTSVTERMTISGSTGDVGIGTSSPKNKLDVSGAQVIGSSYAGVNTAPTNGLLVEGNVGIGTTSPQSQLHIIDQTGSVNRGLILDENTNSITSPLFLMRKSRGTSASPSIVVDGDYLFNLQARAYGSSYISTAGILARVNGAVSGTSVPTDLIFSAGSVNGDAVNAERIRVSGSTGNVGIGTTTPQNKLNVNGDLNVTSNAYLENGNLFYLNPTVNSSFRTNVTNNKLIFYRNEDGVWVSKAEMGDSVTTSDIILDSINAQVYMKVNETVFNNPLAKVIGESTYSSAIEVGNWNGNTTINTETDVFMTRKEADVLSITQPIANETKTGTEFFYNFTTPSTAEGFYFTGATNIKQDYILEENYTGIIYTAIYDRDQSLTIPIWESSSYYDFTQGSGGYLELVENTTVYRDQFDSEVELLANKSYTVKTYFNQSVTVNGTYVGGEFIPWLRTTGTLYNAFKMALYEFGDNNFNGDGNFTTTGNITLGQKLIFVFGQWIDNLVDGWLRVEGNLNITNSTNIEQNLTVNGISDFNRKMLKINKSDNQTIYNGGSWNNITFDNYVLDNDMFSNMPNNYTVKINRSGLYAITYHLKVSAYDKIQYDSRIIVNEVEIEEFCDTGVGSKESSHLTLNTNYNLIHLNEGDEVILQVSHDNGLDIPLYGTSSYLQISEEFY